MKNKFFAFVLAMVMTISLTIPAYASATGCCAYDAPDNPGYTIPGDWAPTADDVIIERRADKAWINVFLPDQRMLAMSEYFLTDVLSAKASDSTVEIVSHNDDCVELAKQIVDQLLASKLVQESPTGDGYTYASDILQVVSPNSWGMPTAELIEEYYTKVPVDVYFDGTAYTNTTDYLYSGWMDLYTYAEAQTEQLPHDYCQIWTVRELDEDRIEVYLENGMIVTMPKAMIVDWADNRYQLGGSFSLDCGSDDEKVGHYDRMLCMEFFRDLLDSLVIQGWTVYPKDALLGYAYEVTAQKVMIENRLVHDVVLTSALEKDRGDDTRAEVEMVFEWFNRGEFEHAAQYPVSIEFIGYNSTGNGYELKPLLDPGGIVYLYYQARWVQINNSLIKHLTGD